MSTPYLPLLALYSDEEIVRLFDIEAHVAAWLEVERALAWAQVDVGLVPTAAAAAIDAAAQVERVDLRLLQERTRVVGYPILPLLEQIVEGAPPDVGRYIHWGATTQDIMDTGDVIRLGRATELFRSRVHALGDELAHLARAHVLTPIAGRTHGQQAVPTTLGAKLAVWLDELTRHAARLESVRSRFMAVQLFGAGGTGAALGPASAPVRRALADRLGLAYRTVPTHTARDDLAELGFVLAAVTATCGKIAREVASLARTEIAEVHETSGPLRGASSTMPQKSNPIDSEGVIGLALLATQQVPVLLQSMQAVHERATGEWQAEWDVIPLLFAASGAAVTTTAGIAAELDVSVERMRENLDADHGLIMAEAVMMAIAPSTGRHRAHEIVYAASVAARKRSVPFAITLREHLDADLLETLDLERTLDPTNYIGEAADITEAALKAWESVNRV